MPPRKPAPKAAKGASRETAKPALAKPSAKKAKPARRTAAKAPTTKAAPTTAKAAKAAKKAPFQDYAFKQGLGMIGEGYPGVTIEQNATTATARFGKHVFASMVRDGDDHVVVGVLVHADDRKGLAARGFVADPHPTGWVQVRLGPDPKAWFRADLTSLVLGTIGALRTADMRTA